MTATSPLERAFVEHHQDLVRILSRQFGDLAEDAVQQAYIIAMTRSPGYFRTDVSLRPWLFTVARHKALVMIARLARQVPLPDELGAVHDDWDSIVATIDCRDALECLTANQRRALLAQAAGYRSYELAGEFTRRQVERHTLRGRIRMRELACS